MNGEFTWGGFEGFREQVATSSVRTNDRIIYVYSIFFANFIFFKGGGGGGTWGTFSPIFFGKKQRSVTPR